MATKYRYGTQGNDYLSHNGTQRYTAYGYGGNDTLVGGSNNDFLYGGSGSAVRGWTKSRRVYGNSWGFLGGLSFALLSAWSCQYYNEKDINLDKLLLNFFQVISQHDWNQPITLTEAGEEYCVQLP